MTRLEDILKFDLQRFSDDDGGGSDTGDTTQNDDTGKDTDTGGDKKDDKDSGNAGDDDNKNKPDGSDAGDTGDDKDGADDKTFTQEELDDIISKRLNRERKKWKEDLEKEKKKAAMDENERLKAEKEDAEKGAQEAIGKANERLIRAEVIAQAASLDVVDPAAAFALMDKEGVEVDDDGNVKGVDKALKSLVKEKPYLVQKKDTKKAGDDQGDDKGNKGGFSMNDLIRKAAGRS